MSTAKLPANLAGPLTLGFPGPQAPRVAAGGKCRGSGAAHNGKSLFRGPALPQHELIEMAAGLVPGSFRKPCHGIYLPQPGIELTRPGYSAVSRLPGPGIAVPGCSPA